MYREAKFDGGERPGSGISNVYYDVTEGGMRGGSCHVITPAAIIGKQGNIAARPGAYCIKPGRGRAEEVRAVT